MTTPALPERFSGYAPDIFGKSNEIAPVEPRAGLHFKPFRLRTDDPDYKIAMGWELKVDDLRSGFRQVGDYDRDYQRTSYAAAVSAPALDSRWYRTLILQQLTTTQNLAAGVGTRGASSSIFAVAMPGSQGFIGPSPSTSLDKSP